MVDEVGDVAMDKQVTGLTPNDLISRHPTTGATHPQKARRLAVGEPIEKSGVWPAAHARWRCSTRTGIRPRLM